MLSRHAPGRVFGDYIDREFGCAGNLGDHRNRCDCGSSDRNCTGGGRRCGMEHEILSRQRAAAHQDARDGGVWLWSVVAATRTRGKGSDCGVYED